MELKRGLTPETLAAISGAYFYHIWLVFIDWPSGPVRAHSGVGQINFGGNVWYGVGDFGKITLPEETLGIASFPAELEIVGLPEDVVSYLDEDVRNRTVRIYGAVVSERSSNLIVGEPFEVWSGYADAMMFSASYVDDDGGEGLDYGIRLEARGGPTVRTAAEIYHTAEDQEGKYPGDTAGRLTINAEAEGSKLTWPES